MSACWDHQRGIIEMVVPKVRSKTKLRGIGHTPLMKGPQAVAHRGDKAEAEGAGLDPSPEGIFAGAELLRLEEREGSALSLQT